MRIWKSENWNQIGWENDDKGKWNANVVWLFVYLTCFKPWAWVRMYYLSSFNKISLIPSSFEVNFHFVFWILRELWFLPPNSNFLFRLLFQILFFQFQISALILHYGFFKFAWCQLRSRLPGIYFLSTLCTLILGVRCYKLSDIQ